MTDIDIMGKIDTVLVAFAKHYEVSKAKYGTWSASPFRDQILEHLKSQGFLQVEEVEARVLSDGADTNLTEHT